ncbi:MAG: hypothetical protein AAGA85_15005, partial [Bacteroidota bacterium]
GLLDPVWPETIRLPDAGGQFTEDIMDVVLGDFIDLLASLPNVTVFTAHSRSPIYQRQIFGNTSRAEWLQKPLDYDLTAVNAYRGTNRQLLLKYFFALGHEGLINLTRCSSNLQNVVSPVIGTGSSPGEFCYGTARPDLSVPPLSGYFGPSCENLRPYFSLEGTRSYRMRARDFTDSGNLFQYIEEQNAEQLNKFVLELINPTPDVETFIDRRITESGG